MLIELRQGLDFVPGLPHIVGRFVATSLKVLFNISGTKQAPAHHMAITGVTLRDTAYTYFDPHGLPSGGDWGLQKQGAITIVGSEARPDFVLGVPHVMRIELRQPVCFRTRITACCCSLS